jgi:hypothetical protein
LILAGRAAVGKIETTSASSTVSHEPKPRTTNDNLDQLLDQLDSLDL